MARATQAFETSVLACALAFTACGQASTSGAVDTDADDPGPGTGQEDGADRSDDDGSDAGDDADDSLDEPGALGPTGLRRLSRRELHQTLTDLIGPVPVDLIETIPHDSETPFDNDYPTQTSSATLVDGLFALSTRVAEHVQGDPAVTSEVLGCTPTGPSDEACLRSFAARFARRGLRRPVTAAELDTYAGFIEFAIDEGDFDVAMTMVIQAVLMNAEFLYRVETGQMVLDDPPTIRLDDLSMASRLSYLLWGTGPDEALLQRAEAGGLSTAQDVLTTAEAMLADERGLSQLQNFHAMWLDYDDLPRGSALERSMHDETDHLVQRVLVDRDWAELFTLTESYLDPELAEHYSLGLSVTEPGWVSYPDKRRAGILSHGAFLSVGEKFGDTSPVERGKAVWTRLMCNDVPPPPPDVDSGVPPAGDPNACKLERYDMSTRPECATCHAILDPIGFGLENYGPRGQWRTHEIDRPDCPIPGEGMVEGLGAFAGAPSLGQLLADSEQVRQCAVRRYVQFAIGRDVTPSDAGVVQGLTNRFKDDDDLLGAVLQFVGSESFSHRVLEQ